MIGLDPHLRRIHAFTGTSRFGMPAAPAWSDGNQLIGRDLRLAIVLTADSWSRSAGLLRATRTRHAR
ncbi:MAG TPA: hypothetical protein VNF73_05090, partial [Candidatus Saccharimonadales bacterium]|nr:hypothetical protein [Candidatus Saccharimonadales bacterium]